MAEEVNNIIGGDNAQDVSNNYLEDINLSEFVDLSNIEGITDTSDVEPEEDTPPQEVKTPEDTGDINAGEQTTGDNDNTEDPSSKDIKEPSPFTPYAKLVKDEGILPNFNIEEWDGSPEGLIKGMQSEIQNGIETYKESFNPQIKWLADNYEAGVPLESLLQIDKQRFDLNSITEEAFGEGQEATQKDIARQYYKETTQFPDATIEKAIERLEVAGDLAEESKGFYNQLKEINVAKEQQLRQQAEQQRVQAQQQQEAQLTQFKEDLSKIDEIVPGVKLNTNIKDKVYKGLTTAVDVHPATGQPMNEIQKAFAENPQLETTFAYLYYATNAFTDFKVFGSAGKKSAVEDFENAVKGMDLKGGTKQRLAPASSDPDLVAQMKNFSFGG